MNWRSEVKELLEITALVAACGFFVFDANGYFDKKEQNSETKNTKQEDMQRPAAASVRRDTIVVFPLDSVVVRSAQRSR